MNVETDDMIVYPRGWWKLSRPCYDKPHRCPGWAGGGWTYGGVQHCHDGSITFGMTREECATLWQRYDTDPAAERELARQPRLFALGQCTDCDVVVLPFWTRKLSPFWWRREAWWALKNWLWWRRAAVQDWWHDRREAQP